MHLIPAIDLRAGKCVRLIQGDYNRQINYDNNPVRQANDFLSAGAAWLHIVDLDGARIGRLVNTDVIKAIASLDRAKVELGGGIRQQASIQQLLDMGVQRVIIGTMAVNDFEWFARMAKEFPSRIVLGLDAHGSKVATHGWTQDSPQKLLDFAAESAKLPLAAIIYTDINSDGMLAGPNFERTKAVIETARSSAANSPAGQGLKIPVIASGGVTEIGDILKLAELGAEGVIVGRALYEGSFTLAEAIKAANTKE